MNMKGIMKGVGIGMAVGGTTAYLRGMMAGSGVKRMAKRRTRAVMKTIGDIAGDMKYMFR